MSLGYLGCAKKSDEDEKAVIYTYGSVNWNETEHKNDERITDGVDTIAISLCNGIMNSYREKQVFPWNIEVFK